MPTPHRRRRGPLTTSLALAAAAVLAATPAAAAQSTAQPDGAIAVSSLGATNEIPGSVAGSLGSLAEPAYPEYVALGDSYAAFGDQSGVAAPCGRSASNYPGLLDANPAVGELTDVTCGGAVTEDLFEAQHPGVAPQLEALDEDTDLVTLSIGGNDVGFGLIVQCITGGLPGSPRDCESELGTTVSGLIADVYGEDGAVADIYAEIAERSPDATVIATQYLPLMPADDADGCAFTQFVGDENLAWAREITQEINDAVDEAARRNGHVSVLPVDDTDRSGCAPADERWVVFADGSENKAAPFHPTALGQQAMAAAIAAAL
ncbi:SGNH/GDSL hydrolase family protein [Dietzia cinnamea]|uniref:SGNH/GDSL hydrolase family protein n=1 Tax=Dietzia cinnamea TaxID=321318 RepID=UPI0021A832AD|nr:SGNH/GDSL hydrolase family protein [Dietzia cinnamea]MCT2275720.1 SGNH/GDSL hydrolase family protein [Dietzia cinnamea]